MLNWLGLWQKKAKIVFLGLDNAGKTTLLYMLKKGSAGQFDPTQQPCSHELKMGRIRFRTFDLGGHAQVRHTWREYYLTADGVVFLVDMSDPARFEESRKALADLLQAPELEGRPFLVLGNKIDKPDAADPHQALSGLQLSNRLVGKETDRVPQGVRPIEFFPCSVIRKQGYREGFQWLAKFL
ncbi:small GTPase superfamily, SAR1-type [Kipferlia bialata]|uniref:Small GTPase superfamily, SAR1-type n=1 Tax=Kipferlia bialata TaxID=797122 RepID=A0A9K3GH15_9EUKA|nr:small GTPase superfamily, SAR1-type [Kipferlia bialata]|eukprot:g3912.t1